MYKKLHFLMDDAGTDTGGGGGGGADTVAAAGGADTVAAAAGTDTVTGGTGGDKGTALQQAQPTPVIPEKYQVKKDDGTIDIEASSLKLADAYSNLEKRLGTGDIPPKTAEEYEITVPDALKETWKPKEDPLLQAFLKDAHAAGLTQKQVDLVVGKYMEMAPELVNAGHALDADTCVAELKKEWKTDEQYKAGIGKAYKAAVGYFGSDADAMIKEYGNDPRFIRGLAKLGNEMGEDKSIQGGGGSGDQSNIEALMASEAYTNPKHPEHAKVSAQVREFYEKQNKAAEAAGHVAML